MDNSAGATASIIIIIIIISGFGIYGAAVVPDSGVGNTWQRLTLVLHEFLSNRLAPSRLHIVILYRIISYRHWKNCLDYLVVLGLLDEDSPRRPRVLQSDIE